MDMGTVHIVFVRKGSRELYAVGGEDFLTPVTGLSVGFDLRACFTEETACIAQCSRLFIPVGISVQPCSTDVAGFVYSRSGLGARDGLTVAQGVGVIDSDYTGEILVPLLNTSGKERVVQRGERIAQLVFQPIVRPRWKECARLIPTDRGSGGFGHTGRQEICFIADKL
ncbi:MAG: dUTP diphosphatase [Desulfovibrio sp.]|jgi:dUTP pyrophosphatase|nr:dUTP diphosphatase [Desulfovibrio sp.]